MATGEKSRQEMRAGILVACSQMWGKLPPPRSTDEAGRVWEEEEGLPEDVLRHLHQIWQPLSAEHPLD